MSRTATEPTVPPPDPRIIYSPLCRTVSRDGITVELRIYRGESDPKWTLEVLDETGVATIWDDLFDTDQDAQTTFERVVAKEGMQTFLDDGDVETLH